MRITFILKSGNEITIDDANIDKHWAYRRLREKDIQGIIDSKGNFVAIDFAQVEAIQGVKDK